MTQGREQEDMRQRLLESNAIRSRGAAKLVTHQRYASALAVARILEAWSLHHADAYTEQ